MKYSVNALHKTASVFLGRYFKEVAQIANIKFFSIDIGNVSEFENETSNSLRCPSRGFPKNLNDDIFYIFVFRNPLDILVSEYYSFGWTHGIKGSPNEKQEFIEKRKLIQEMSVDTYCLKYADDLLGRFKFVIDMNLKKNGDTYKCFTYEDLVLNFKKWNAKICELFSISIYHGLIIHEKFSNEFVDIKETTPEEIFNGKRKHKRKVIPGDHLEKLHTETIDILNEKFKDVLLLINRVKFKNRN